MALVDYFGVSEKQLLDAVARMREDGRHELAAAVLRWSQSQFSESPRLAAEQKATYRTLMEKYQEFNPFKFILYAGWIDQELPQIDDERIRSGEPPGGAAQR